MSRTAIKPELGALGVSLCMLLVGAGAGPTSAPTFEERVAAERAILAVYHSHQIGSNRTLDEVATRELLERRVRTYLKQSVALETVWNTPVTAAMLEAESARIAREGRLPDRLKEIYEALGNDPVLILECFVRPSLVGRLTRNFFESDKRFQDTARENAWDQWWTRSEGQFDESQIHPILRAQARLAAPDSAPDQFDPYCAKDDTWDNGSLATSAEYRAGPAVWTGSLVLFWNSSKPVLRYDPLTDTWTKSTATNHPADRSRHTAIWADNVMIIWGGDDGVYFNTGGRYDPVTDTWATTSTVNAPSPRSRHTAVWTGTRMIIWGGADATAGINTGGVYDPETDTWTTTSIGNAPSPRVGHSAVWTGTRMIVFGGGNSVLSSRTGALYDLVADTWTATTTVGTIGRERHSAVWTGSLMIVWGGFSEDAPTDELANSGARYDPVSDKWTSTSVPNAPEGRWEHPAVWTGKVMVVWGGKSVGSLLETGGRYDPQSDTWLPTTRLNAPEERRDHGMVWTGSRMIVFGGITGFNFGTRIARRGARYDPETDTWTAMLSTSNSPSARLTHTIIWTGSHLVLWGGFDAGYPLTSGGRYDPVTDSWVQTSMTDAPLGRGLHSAVWDGDRMLVWGGVRPELYVASGVLRTGGRYDPLADSWEPMSVDGAPDARMRHTAIWSGSRMIVWGGSADPLFGPSLMLKSGGRYDPATDTWGPTTLVDAPAGRVSHTAVWSDTQMVIWGGDGSRFMPLGNGGRYDPVADLWRPVALNGAPDPRLDHTAVWTGDQMVVWGGRISLRSVLGTGGRYDPVADTWSETSLTGAPAPRWFHASVWTGRQMVIWGGGISGRLAYNTGGRYDPVADTWVPTSTAGAPLLGGSPAVWTGGMMITIGDPGIAGGRYFLTESPDADEDGFTICAGDCDDTDSSKYPGADELCDGNDNNCDGSLPLDEMDADGDGYRTCAGDCDDADVTVNPDSVELPGNLGDEDCDGVLLCDPGDDWKNHGQFVRCVALECRQLVASGLAMPQECAALVSNAARWGLNLKGE